MITDIDQRSGWPDELKILLRQYPRETWQTSGNGMARFWLDKHDYFRRQCRSLEAIGVDLLEGRKAPREFGSLIVARLQSFLSALHGHHQIEDFHYFPAFRDSHKALASGFDILASDHELLHGGILEIVEKINIFLTILKSDELADSSACRHAGELYVQCSETVYRRLMRHLDDEEDLIIPVMLHRE